MDLTVNPLSRTQPKECPRCKRIWWSWGLRRDVCHWCEPFSPKQVQTIIAGINNGNTLYSL